MIDSFMLVLMIILLIIIYHLNSEFSFLPPPSPKKKSYSFPARLSPFSLQSDKSSEEFFPLAKQKEKKKRHYRGSTEGHVQDKRERSKEHRKHRPEREKRDRRPRSPLPRIDSVHGKDHSSQGGVRTRRSLPHSPYGHSSRGKRHGREREEDSRYSREDEEVYRWDETRWSSREGRRRDASQEHHRPLEDSYFQGRDVRSPIQEDVKQLPRRHERERRVQERPSSGRRSSRDRDREREERQFGQWRRRLNHPPSDRSPVSGVRSPSSSASSRESATEQELGVVGEGMELRQENIDILIKDFEQVKESGGEDCSESPNASSSTSSQKGSNEVQCLSSCE